MSQFQGVADTLFIPLAARIYVSKRFPEYFYDETALSLEQYISEESKPKFYFQYTQIASVARYYNLDAMTNSFLSKHERCNVINLGAGLETGYFRLKAHNAMFYEVDLPLVIEKRRTLLGEHPDEILIGGDMFQLEWAKQINTSLPSLLIVSGVFHYFHEEQVIGFIHDLQELFPDGELIFDATNETGIKYTNKYVKKTGNTSAPMFFFVNDCAAFAKKCGITLIEYRPFFTDARKMLSKKLGLYTRIAMKVADDKKRTILLHLKLK